MGYTPTDIAGMMNAHKTVVNDLCAQLATSLIDGRRRGLEEALKYCNEAASACRPEDALAAVMFILNEEIKKAKGGA
jgi:hypothetical protein